MAKRKQDTAVEQALFQSAVGGVRPVRKAYKLKRVLYDETTGRKQCEFEEIVHDTEEVYDPPNLQAQQFWLRSRNPAAWDSQPAADSPPPGIVELPAQLPDPTPDRSEDEIRTPAQT